jgi:guanylate kinase
LNKVKNKITPLLFCFCGPTASGKSTICREVLKSTTGLTLSISTTTRAPRHGEVDGVDYFFVNEAEFKKRQSSGQFLEYAFYSGNAYGTEKSNIDTAFNKGSDLLLDIEVQGVENLKKMFPENVIVIFIFPPSMDILKERLLKRKAESEEQMSQRLETAEKELSILRNPKFSDYLVINNKLEVAVEAAKSIIFAEKSRLTRFTPSDLDRMFGKPTF